MIRIVTDSAADLTIEQAAAMDVKTVPMQIHFGDTVYYQEQDPGFRMFYKKLANCEELPTTSQVPPADFAAQFEEAKRAGDSVVVVTISSQLSGTFQSANIAKEMVGHDAVWIVDSGMAVIGQRMLVDRAVALRAQGKQAGEIAAALDEMKRRVVLCGEVGTLKYLQKGGRISKSVKLVGTVLGIRPVIIVRDGRLTMAEKARGEKAAMEALIQLALERGELDQSAPIYYGYTYDIEPLRRFEAMANPVFKPKHTVRYPVGGVVGTHLGPGAVILGYLHQ